LQYTIIEEPAKRFLPQRNIKSLLSKPLYQNKPTKSASGGPVM